jgi:hypothetical protein
VEKNEEDEGKEDFAIDGKGGRREKINCSLRRRHSCVVQNNVPYNTGFIVMT